MKARQQRRSCRRSEDREANRNRLAERTTSWSHTPSCKRKVDQARTLIMRPCGSAHKKKHTEYCTVLFALAWAKKASLHGTPVAQYHLLFRDDDPDSYKTSLSSVSLLFRSLRAWSVLFSTAFQGRTPIRSG